LTIVDVYKISIALAMSSNHGAVLGALSSHLLRVDGQVNRLHGNFGRLKTAISGALAVTAGVALFKTMESIVDKTKEYSDELVKLQRLGGDMTKAVVSGDMSKRAFDIAQRVPMNVTDLLKIPGASYSILGQEDSMKVWESLARFSWVMQSDKNFKGDAGKDLQDLLRASELTGRLTDPNTHKAAIDELQRFLDLSAKVMAATHNMVNPQTLLGMAKQGGFTMRGLSDEGFMTQAIMAQAMGGQRAGTAFLSLWQQMAGGTMFTRTAEGMQDVGLLKPEDWHTDHGRVILHNEASRRLTNLIGKDPLDLAANLVEHFKNQGITDPLEQMRMVMRTMNRQTTQRFTAEQVSNFHQMIAERDRMRQGMGANDAFGTIMNQSVTANIEAVKNAWTNLLTAVAGPNSENVISVLQSLTSGMNAITRAINRTNPDTLKDIGIGLGILAGALTVGGIAALIAAMGPAGWIVTGIGALVAAAAKWGPDILKGVYSGLEGIADAVNRFIAWLVSLPGKIAKSLGSWMGSHAPDGNDPTAADPWGGLLHKQRFEPGIGGQPKPQPVYLTLNMDGRRLAQAVSQAQDALYRYETNPTDFNGSGRPA
jgi:hypothetical protein